MVPLKYLSNLWRTLEMLLINCEVNLILIWLGSFVMLYSDFADQATTLSMSFTKRYLPVVTLSTQDNPKPLQELKSGFKRRINWNKYQQKVTIQAQNQYLHYLIDPTFQGGNIHFLLSFGDHAYRISYKQYFLPTVKMQCYD